MNSIHENLEGIEIESKAELETDKIGLWVFLATEATFLSALFTAYLSYRIQTYQAFHLGTLHMNLWAGTLNTFLLLTSSFFIAIADWAYKNKKFKLSLYLILSTIILGTVFLIIKMYEYAEHIRSHLLPGYDFHIANEVQGLKLFFVLYYLMTGFHALHLIAGLIFLAIISRKVYNRSYLPDQAKGLEFAALYWHFVDVIWVFLFPLLYLVDRL